MTRWRIYQRPIIANVSNVRKIVQATLALHNFILQNEEQLTGKKSYLYISTEDVHICRGIRNILLCRSRGKNNAIAVREGYLSYFQDTGALSFQWKKSVAKRFLMYLFVQTI